MIKAKFRSSKRLRFEDTKRIMSHEIRSKSYGTFEKQAPGFSRQMAISFLSGDNGDRKTTSSNFLPANWIRVSFLKPVNLKKDVVKEWKPGFMNFQ